MVCGRDDWVGNDLLNWGRTQPKTRGHVWVIILLSNMLFEMLQFSI
jgi:hypothetical protein